MPPDIRCEVGAELWLPRPEGAPTAGVSRQKTWYAPVYAYATAHASQLVRFVLIGAALAMLNLAFLYGLRTWFQLPDPVAVAAMYVFGVLIHFPAHRWITYHAQDRPVRPQALRYIVMLMWNFGILQLLVALAASLSISPYLAVVASTGLNMVANFLAMTHIVFAKGREP
jgi:putative flippase GtrA